MPPFQQVSSYDFCPARAALVNCKCYYCEVETPSGNKGSAEKWWATQAHRTGLPSAGARSAYKLSVLGCNTHYYVLHAMHFNTRWSHSVSLCGLPLRSCAVVAPIRFHVTITALS